jgi:hypothetical protein
VLWDPVVKRIGAWSDKTLICSRSLIVINGNSDSWSVSISTGIVSVMLALEGYFIMLFLRKKYIEADNF